MFLKTKDKKSAHSLREQFMLDLFEELQNKYFEKSEFLLREELKKKLTKGRLF